MELVFNALGNLSLFRYAMYMSVLSSHGSEQNTKLGNISIQSVHRKV